MSRKKLLSEATVRRFMQLAGNNKYSKSFLTEAEGDEMEGEELEIEDAEAAAPEGAEPAADVAPEEEAAGACRCERRRGGSVLRRRMRAGMGNWRARPAL